MSSIARKLARKTMKKIEKYRKEYKKWKLQLIQELERKSTRRATE